MRLPPTPALTPGVASLAARRRTRRSARRHRAPRGALYAIGWILLLHLVAALLIFPYPQPRRDLRRKLIPLTRHVRPHLVVAGDSRAECGLIPAVLAGRLNLDPPLAINMATPACDLPGVVAGYRAFADRFADRPIMIVSVSAVEMNDRAAEHLIGDETLAASSLPERFELVPFKRAVTSLVLPERELVRRLVVEPLFWHWDDTSAAHQGYRGKASHHDYPADRLAKELDYLAQVWYRDPVLDGIRWRHFREGVQILRDAGVQLVLLDPPTQPAFHAGMAHRPMAAADARFHQQLAAFCQAEDLPLLRYSAEELDPGEPAGIFVSLMHLNCRGAALLSERVGQDLAAMVVAGRLTLPGV